MDNVNYNKEVRVASNVLANEQYVQVVIHSLPHSWEHMRLNMMHNENIQNFNNILRHLKLKVKWTL